MFDKLRAKRLAEKEKAMLIASDDYLCRLKRSCDTFCGIRHSTFGGTLSIEEIRSLMYKELNRILAAPKPTESE